MSKKDLLKTYKEKRDLKKSGEPAAKKVTDTQNLFVIQKHDASHLHYDFRLAIDGVLVSWAIPKGPSLNPTEKRLAIQTEDHPMEYATFEGIIPEGNYGAGTVMVWDTGKYKNIKTKHDKIIPIQECLKNGQIEIWLEGEKIKGGYALIRMTRSAQKNQWLLIKLNDEHASQKRNPVNTQTKSVLTGRTLAQIKAEST